MDCALGHLKNSPQTLKPESGPVMSTYVCGMCVCLDGSIFVLHIQGQERKRGPSMIIHHRTHWPPLTYRSSSPHPLELRVRAPISCLLWYFLSGLDGYGSTGPQGSDSTQSMTSIRRSAFLSRLAPERRDERGKESKVNEMKF